jgi:hypothetical protein
MSRVTLGRFLLDHPAFAVEADSIYSMRSRARKAGKPDPFPFVVSRGRGHDLLVDLEAYNQYAREAGRPLFEGRGQR